MSKKIFIFIIILSRLIKSPVKNQDFDQYSITAVQCTILMLDYSSHKKKLFLLIIIKHIFTINKKKIIS